MTTLTPSQIAKVAHDAGFTGDALVRAVAVALAESDGRTDVVNSIGCVGLWQINQPVHVKEHATWTREFLKVPANNARAAFVLSNGGKSWGPWVSSYGRQQLMKGRAARAVGGLSTDTPAVVTPPASSSDSGFDPSTWFRVVMFVAGGVLLLLTVAKITGVANVASNVIPVGRVLKGVKR